MDRLKDCIAAKDVLLLETAPEEIEQPYMRCPNPNKASRAISPGFIEDVRQGV